MAGLIDFYTVKLKMSNKKGAIKIAPFLFYNFLNLKSTKIPLSCIG